MIESPMSAKSLAASEAPDSSGKTWSIAEVERETGLGKDTLRVWERRYGFPSPLRDSGGERAYPQDQLNRLRMIKRLLDADHRPGQVVSLPVAELQARLDSLADASVALRADAVPDAGALDKAHEWVAWLAQDKTDLIRQALQQAILRGGLGHVVDRLVAPLCGQVGLAWMRGDVSVYQEHLFTEIVQSVLREAIAAVDAVGRNTRERPRVLLTTTSNELHGLGLLMAECHFALECCERFLLGTSTPTSDILHAIRQLRIDVLALSFSAYASRKDVVDNLKQLSEQLPDGVEIWVGGAAANAHGRALPHRVVLMRQAGEISAQVRAWRQRKGLEGGP